MIKTLLGVRLRSAFSSMCGKRKDGTVGKPSVGKLILFAVLYLYIAVVFIGLFAMLALSLAPVLIPAGLDATYFGLFILLSFSMIFIFSIFETKSEIFDCKDNELLLAMPIKPGDIVLSRTLAVLIYNYIECAAVMLPAIVIYAVLGGSAIGVIGGIISFLTIPLLATSLSSGVGYLLAIFNRRFKKNTLITTAISLVFLIAYMVGYFALMESVETIIDGDGAMKLSSPVMDAIGSAAMMNPLALVAEIILSLGAAALAWRIISVNYISIVTDNRGAKKVEYKSEKTVGRSAFVALSAKELRRFFSSSVYMLNGGLGVIFSLIASIAAVIGYEEVRAVGDLLSFGITTRSALLSPIMISALIFFGMTNMISCAAVSLEGKNLWITKSMPISARDVLLSKCVPHVLVTSVPGLLSAVLLMIACGTSPAYWAFFILTPIAANIAMAEVGVAINVAFPKFEFDNEAQPIKQSLASFLFIIANILWCIVLMAMNLVLAFIGLGLLAVFATLIINCGLAALMYVVISGPCARKYDKF